MNNIDIELEQKIGEAAMKSSVTNKDAITDPMDFCNGFHFGALWMREEMIKDGDKLTDQLVSYEATIGHLKEALNISSINELKVRMKDPAFEVGDISND
jgi:hypothetical protein